MSSAPATILPDPQHLRLLGLAGDAEGIVATVAAIAPTSVCPQCGQPSQRIHSRYVRHVFDLPWHGVAFRLDLHVRRFFCDHATCSQRIFTERLPGVVASSARHHAAAGPRAAPGRRSSRRSGGKAALDQSGSAGTAAQQRRRQPGYATPADSPDSSAHAITAADRRD